MKTSFKGYLLGAVAAVSYGTNPLFALPLYDMGMDADSMLLFRYLLALPMLWALVRLGGGSLSVRRDQLPGLAAMGLLVSLSSLTLFESFRYMDAGIASTMLFVYPVMVAAIMALRYGERISPLSVLCLAASVGGIALLYRSGDGLPLSLHGTLLVMVSALAYALYIVGVNKSRVGAMPPQKMTFYVLLFGLLLFAVRSLAGGGLVMPHGAAMWGNLLGLALFPTTLSFVCISRAIRCIGSTPTAVLGALEPLTAIVVGIFVFGESMTPRIACGIMLILAAVTALVARDAISAYLSRLLNRLTHAFSHGHVE